MKRLLICCLAVALLLAAMPTFGIVTRATSADPIVTEIVFPENGTSETSTFNPTPFWYFGGDSEENAYTISFDYYLPKDAASLDFNSVSGFMTTVSGSRKMDTSAGHHRVEWTTWTTVKRNSSLTGQFVACITAPVGTEMYIWNWSVKIGGEEVEGNPMTEAQGQTRGTVGNALSTYPWSATMDGEYPASLEIATMPAKTAYTPGEKLNTTGLSLTLTYYNGKTETITSGYTVSGFNPDTVGSQTVTVAYAGLTVTFNVAVGEVIVTEITFPTNGTSNVSNWSPMPAWYYGGNSKETPFVISFDYYLPETIGGIRFFSVSGGMTNISGGTMERTAGIHHFELVTYNSSKGQLVAAIESIVGAEMYIWNWSVKVGGEEVTPTDKSGEWNGKTNGTVGKDVRRYYWYAANTGEPFYMEADRDMRLTEITFTATNKQWHEKVYRSSEQSAENPYIVTFDYYLTASSGVTVTFGSRASGIVWGGDSVKTLSAGRHTYTVKCSTTASGGTFAPRLVSTGNATLYMWNYSCTLNGTKISGAREGDDPTASITTAPLSGFSWFTGEQDVSEAPVTENTAILYNEQHSSFDEQGEDMRQQIVNTADDIAPSVTGKTYYVSMSGSNANNGLTPATAWRNTDAVSANASKFNAGDVVLFERGGVYRGTTQMTSGVSYGAYGTGPKPCLYASPRNYADPELWEEVSANVWRVDALYLTDIGNVVFDHGVVCASDYKVCETDKMTVDNLKSNYQYYHDLTSGYVYMYYDGGNPAEQYSDIEFCLEDSVFYMGSHVKKVTDILIDNLCIKYSGAFGIVFRDTENVTITNCEIGYIGGSMLSADARYGNGIEFNSHATTVLVENNWIYQCYDAGYTNQGSSAYHTDLSIRNNLVEYCHYNFEIYGSNVTRDENNEIISTGGLLKNCIYEDNMLRFAGYGFGTNNRFGSNDSVCANVCYWRRVIPSENVVLRNNIFDVSYRFLVVSAYVNDQRDDAPTFTDNIWVQHDGPKSAVALQVDTDVSGWLNHSQYELSSDGLATMRESVAVMDLNPTAVIHERNPLVLLTATSLPTKTVYEVGEPLDLSGLALKLDYSFGETAVLSDGYEVLGFDTSTAGNKTVTVRFANVKTTFAVTVNANTTATVKSQGAQIRSGGGLRFISTIGGVNVTRNADGTANYSAATIEVNGVTYDVVTVGTVFARKTKLGDADLTLGMKGVSYDIPAARLQKTTNAPNGITVSEGDILFTGVITDIPASARTQVLVVRAYVAYTDNGTVKYVYGDAIERSYQQILSVVDG